MQNALQYFLVRYLSKHGMSMSVSFLEIVELPSGEIVLRRSDEEDAEPLVTMSFSQELVDFLQGDQFEIARVMLDACIEEVGRKTETDAGEYIPEDRVLH
ncbi:hypothetical protein [uncultured Endozoicomonas sp.]|uniref:hypothetical protein n=1 Tax=uncultured Endozoicomonas sp. TaxID=432652 RepID=UPI0026380251|nr:hypothetical protein [uncultured Endozoicomonas sp.]